MEIGNEYMTKGRDNAAESMKDVFALIRSRRQSGVLSVERFENGVFEEGEIHFQAGKPVQGFSGKLTGDAAMNHLMSWRRVYFAFLATPPSSPSSHTKDTPHHSQSSANVPHSGSFTQTHSGPLHSPVTGPLSGDARNPLPIPERTTGPLARQNGYEPAALIPHKVSRQQDVMSLSLTRPQRSVYLLIDGHRSVADIARFTGKGIPEVMQIILDLRARNLVNM